MELPNMRDPIAPAFAIEETSPTLAVARQEARRQMVAIQQRYIAKQIEYMGIDLGNYPAPVFKTEEPAPGDILNSGQLSSVGQLMIELSAGEHVPNPSFGEHEPSQQETSELARLKGERAQYLLTSYVDQTYIPEVDADFDPASVTIVGE